MDKTEIRTVLKYEFFVGNTTSHTAWTINGAFHFKVITQQTISRCAKFRSSKFDLTNE